MAINATISVTVTLTGDIAGSVTVPAQSNAASPGERNSVDLASGPNTLTPPAGASALILVPPQNSTVAKTLKGVTGDTGVPLSPNAPAVIPLPAGAGALVLNAAAIETVTVYWL